MQMNKSRLYFVGLACLAAAMLVGCKSASQSTPAATGKSASSVYTSKTFTTSYAGALDASSQLMLGMLKSEGTDNAITADQARALLPVIQSLQGQVLKSDAERNAVWANVEAQLAPAQLSAIANLHLTQNDLQTWTQDNSQGLGAGSMPGGPAPQQTPGAGPGQSGLLPQGTPGAGPAQGGPRPQGTPGAPPAFGGPAGGAGAGAGQNNVLLNSLIRLLMQRAAGSRAVTRPPVPPASPLPTPTKP